jgi:hypothetical protein
MSTADQRISVLLELTEQQGQAIDRLLVALQAQIDALGAETRGMQDVVDGAVNAGIERSLSGMTASANQAEVTLKRAVAGFSWWWMVAAGGVVIAAVIAIVLATSSRLGMWHATCRTVWSTPTEKV